VGDTGGDVISKVIMVWASCPCYLTTCTSRVGPLVALVVMTSPPQIQGTFDLLHDVRNEAKAIYERAWGRPWPHQHSSMTSKTVAILSPGDAMPMDLGDDDDSDYAYGRDFDYGLQEPPASLEPLVSDSGAWTPSTACI
jgi:hypothetical protein